MKPLFAALLWLAGMACGLAAPLCIDSPDGTVRAQLDVHDGQLLWTLTLDGKEVLRPSPLGLMADGTDLGREARIGKVETRIIRESFPTRGAWATATTHCNAAVVAIAAGGRDFTLELRVFDDGAALRYGVPGKGRQTIADEATTFALPRGSKYWFATDYEAEWSARSEAEVASGTLLTYPLVAELPGGSFAVVSEAMSVDYLATCLKHTGEGAFRTAFQLKSWFAKTLETEGDVRTPWRAVLVNRDLNGLVNNSMIVRLAEPPSPELAGADWIEPGACAWAWVSGGFLGQNPKNMRDHVEAAAKMGWKYLIVDDGWEHWENKWAEVKKLCDFGAEHRVKILLWKPTNDKYRPQWQVQRFGELAYIDGLIDPSKRIAFLEHCREAGVAGLKVDFVGEGSLAAVNFYRDMLRDAAKYRMVINFHGSSKPCGLERTYPNELTREALRGIEHHGSRKEDFYRFDAIYPFTRYIIGHGDYTPYIQPGNCGSTPHQLATLIAFLSPLNAYAAHPAAILTSEPAELVKSIPTVWDETRALKPSKIGELAAIARRSGPRWFLAVLNGTEARQIEVDLGEFLPKGTWKMIGYEDETLTRMKPVARTLTAPEKLTIRMPAGGGFAARFTPE